MINANYHTHLYLCKHAEGDFDDYIKAAIEKGYTDIGFSDHCPLSDELMNILYTRRMSFNEYHQIYLTGIEAAKKKYQGIINVHSGLEVEFFDAMKDYYPEFIKNHEYLILGQHYFRYEGQYYSAFSQLSIEKAEAYCNDVVRALNTGYFKILAHPDLFIWGYPMWDEIAVEISKKIIQAAIDNDVILEINSNGIRNCEKKNRYIIAPSPEFKKDIKYYAYPNINFLKMAKSMGAKMIINEDVHNPNDIGDDATELVCKYVELLNIETIKCIDFKK